MSQHPSVLSFCNDVRRTLNRQPVPRLRRGVIQTASRCPVANTINFGARRRVLVDSVSVELFDPEGQTIVIAKTPSIVADFISEIDAGALPEFEGEGWAE